MAKLTIDLPIAARNALYQRARRQHRKPAEQAVFIICRALVHERPISADKSTDADIGATHAQPETEVERERVTA